MKTTLRFSMASLLVLLAPSCAPKAEQAGQAEPAPSDVTYAHVAPNMLTAWMIGLVNRTPSPGATTSRTLGEGTMQVTVPADAQSWFETADVDSNGMQEKVVFMWDGPNKIMYAYTTDPVTLSDGTMADKGVMIAQFAAGNTRNRPTGSGWYAYALSRDTTGTDHVEGSLFGCTFDATGAELECGTGTWDRNGNQFNVQARPQ